MNKIFTEREILKGTIKRKDQSSRKIVTKTKNKIKVGGEGKRQKIHISRFSKIHQESVNLENEQKGEKFDMKKDYTKSLFKNGSRGEEQGTKLVSNISHIKMSRKELKRCTKIHLFKSGGQKGNTGG